MLYICTRIETVGVKGLRVEDDEPRAIERCSCEEVRRTRESASLLSRGQDAVGCVTVCILPESSTTNGDLELVVPRASLVTVDLPDLRASQSAGYTIQNSKFKLTLLYSAFYT